MHEIAVAIRHLKRGKAPEPDGLPPEVSKAALVPFSNKLKPLFTAIWEKADVPADLKETIIIPVFKKKEDRSSCDNYRGISLLSIAGKILSRIAMRRLASHVASRVLSETQAGFRPTRGTSDKIFCARQLQEKSREQNVPLYAIFLTCRKHSTQ